MGCKIGLNVMGVYGPVHCWVTLAEKSRQAICAPTCLKFRLIVVVLIFILFHHCLHLIYSMLFLF